MKKFVKNFMKKSVICFVVVICLLLNSGAIFTGFLVKEPSENNFSESTAQIVYSSDNNLSFDKIAPIYQENGDEEKLSIIRSGDVSKPQNITVAVYDNSADYGVDYFLKYNGNKIEKIEGSRSIFSAFRDDGVLSSNLPVNAAEILVSYDDTSSQELTEDVNASEMLYQLDEMDSRVAEFEVTFGAGEAVADIYVEPIDDEISEYDESFIVVIFGSDNNLVENSQIMCDIADNEEDPTVHIEFTETRIEASEETGVAQVELERSGDLATGTSALLLRDETPIGYVDFSPFQTKQVVLALSGTYRLVSTGNYTVGESTLLVSGDAKDMGPLMEGADSELDSIPLQYDQIADTLQGAPNLRSFPTWVQSGATETDDYIVVMGDESNGLFEKDSSSTDGNVSFLSSSLYQLNTEGGASNGYLFLRTKDRYNLNGIESVEGSVYISDLTTGYCDVIFGVWNEGHAKIYTNDNKSLQNLTYALENNMGWQYIYYCNSDLPGVWDCGWNAYTPNGFKMNKRTYNVFIEQPESLDFAGIEYAPTVVDSQNQQTLKMHSSKKNITISYTVNDRYPVRLVGFEFFNGNTMKRSGVISLSEANIKFDQAFLDKYDSSWGYDVTDESGKTTRTFTIRPVFEKIEADIEVKKSSNGSLTLESHISTPYKGETLIFKGEGNDGYGFAGVSYQYRMFEGGEIMAHGMVGNDGDTVKIVLDNSYGHYTFQGVFSESANQLSVTYGEENPHGKLNFDPGVVLSGSDYKLSDYYPLMADPDDGYITVWGSDSNYYFGDIFYYQLDGNEANSNVSVRFLAEGALLDANDASSKITLATEKISGKLVRSDMNYFDKSVANIPLSNTHYTITTSHGIYSGVTDENGNYAIDDFTGVVGGIYSMAVSYQGRIGYITFEYDGAGNNYNLTLPQFAIGGFYPVSITATIDGQGHGSNTLVLTNKGTVQLTAKIYVHSEEYRVTDVKFHFLSTLSGNYGDELKVISAKPVENANMGDKHQLWAIELSETTAIPEHTQIYVSVSGEHTYSSGETVVSTIDLANSGYVVEKALQEENPPIQQSIPEIPGVQVADTDIKNFELPILGVMDMSFSSRTGGYFIQQGSWDQDGDVYTLVCGQSVRPNYLTGMLGDRYKDAMKTKELLAAAASNAPNGKSDLKKSYCPDLEVAPVFMLKFTVAVVDKGDGTLVHKLIGLDVAIGEESYLTADIPFNVYGVPCYVCVSVLTEAYCQMQMAFNKDLEVGDALDNVIKELDGTAECDINAFIAAPVVKVGVKGGVGLNGWVSIFAEGTLNLPFVVGFTPLDSAGTVEFDIGVGAELIFFSGKVAYKTPEFHYGADDLYDELKTIQSYQSEPTVAAYFTSTGESYDTFEEALNNTNFSIMERPKNNNGLLQAGAGDDSLLASKVFKNTKVKLLELDSGKIMALFLTDNGAPDGNLNYLSVAYAISEDDGKTWSDVKYVSENIDSSASSFQYDINVFELEDRILITWSEADFDTMLQGVDPQNLTAAQMAKVINAMNLKGRFFDSADGTPIGDAFIVAENSAVFCGALDAVQNGDDVYVYYQRTALSTKDDVTVEEIIKTQRTIAMAHTTVNDTQNWTSTQVRAMSDEGGQYLITEVEPFVHDGILGEIVVLDRNGMVMSYDTESQSLVPDVEDRQLFIRTYSFDENGVPTTTALMPLTDTSDCAQSPQVVSNDDYLYLFWNHNGEIVYAPDFVAKSDEDEITLNKAIIIANANGIHTVNDKNEFSSVHISSDESLHIGAEFTVSMSDEGSVFICWVADDKEEQVTLPTDEIYGMILETRLVSDVVSNLDNISASTEVTPNSEGSIEHQLFAIGSPVALTDEDHPIGALDSICFESGNESKFLLAYTRLNGTMRNNSTYADIMVGTSVDKPELSAEIEFVDYPMPGETEKAYIKIYNDGFAALNGYSVTISGIGDDIKITVNGDILPGRSTELCVEIPIPEDFSASAKLSVKVSGLDDQSEYTAETEEDVLYGAYFVPTDIPSINAIPNSGDCVVKVGVKNIGNAAGSPKLEYLNAVYATDNDEEILKYENESNIELSPNGEGTVSFTMTDTHLGSGKYSTVQVHMGDNYDQSTEAPMPNAVSLSIEQIAYNPEVDEDTKEDENDDNTDNNTGDNTDNNTDDNIDESENTSTVDDNTIEGDGALGTGAIIGIVVGSVAVVGISTFALVWFVIKKKSFAELICIFKK